MRTLRHLLLAAAITVTLALAGCSGDHEPEGDAPAAEPTSAASWIETPSGEEIREAIEGGATVLDVRTPQEYAAGHLRGARNLDFNDPGFEQEVGRLDPKGEYVLYCASGNRAGQAAALMLDQGFTDVINAGGFEALAGAGFATEEPAGS